MPIQHAIWQVAEQPAILPASKLASEHLIESMIVRDPRILYREQELIAQSSLVALHRSPQPGASLPLR